MEKTATSVLTDFYGGSLLRVTLSLLLGLFVSFLIVWGIINAQRLDIATDEPVYEELRAVVIPPPPPPPPQLESSTPPPPLPNLPEFDAAPNEEPIQIAYSTQPVVDQTIPIVKPRIQLSLGDFKPNFEPPDSKRKVYSKKEVDQPPILIYRKIPDINSRLFNSVDLPRVKILYIVNTKGKVETINVFGSASPEFDKRVIEAVKQCRFKPARKDGQKVNCWIQQRVIIKMGKPSPFSVD